MFRVSKVSLTSESARQEICPIIFAARTFHFSLQPGEKEGRNDRQRKIARSLDKFPEKFNNGCETRSFGLWSRSRKISQVFSLSFNFSPSDLPFEFLQFVFSFRSSSFFIFFSRGPFVNWKFASTDLSKARNSLKTKICFVRRLQNATSDSKLRLVSTEKNEEKEREEKREMKSIGGKFPFFLSSFSFHHSEREMASI